MPDARPSSLMLTHPGEPIHSPKHHAQHHALACICTCLLILPRTHSGAAGRWISTSLARSQCCGQYMCALIFAKQAYICLVWWCVLLSGCSVRLSLHMPPTPQCTPFDLSQVPIWRNGQLSQKPVAKACLQGLVQELQRGAWGEGGMWCAVPRRQVIPVAPRLDLSWSFQFDRAFHSHSL